MIAGNTLIPAPVALEDAGGILSEAIALILWISAGRTRLYKEMRQHAMPMLIVTQHSLDASPLHFLQILKESVMRSMEPNGLLAGAILQA